MIDRVLDETATEYNDKDDLPTIYRAVAMNLNIAPSQHTVETFMRILGGATSVVEGIGSLRNKIGDAHGQERRFGDLLAMSGVHPIASEKHIFRDGRKVPKTTFSFFERETDQAATRLMGPRKSILPMSTPLWRRMAYAVARWKNVFGIVICSR
jgi:Abortive infection C-terminus